MSHDSHSAPAADTNMKPTTSFRSSFWLIVILAGLFIAAVNFASVMSHDDGGHGNGHGEATHEGHGTMPAEHTDAHGSDAPVEEHH